MGLQVIGAGLSRTGTFSLKRALEQLGVGRCYHMHELSSHPEHAALWERAACGATVDWDGMFEGYSAACDAPACPFWRELSQFYPGAKVILTVRNPSEWYESMRSTVVELMQRPTLIPDASAQEVLRTAQRLVLGGFCGGTFDDVDETALLGSSRAELLLELEGASNELLDWNAPYRRFAPGADWRCIRATLAHIANGETQYYLRAVGHRPDQRTRLQSPGRHSSSAREKRQQRFSRG